VTEILKQTIHLHRQFTDWAELLSREAGKALVSDDSQENQINLRQIELANQQSISKC